MRRISRNDSPLLRQFKRWAAPLLRCNPGYVTDPGRLRDYIRGPNWDAAGPEYAHYRTFIELYGDELLGLFERLRADPVGLDEYRSLLEQAGIEEDK